MEGREFGRKLTSFSQQDLRVASQLLGAPLVPSGLAEADVHQISSRPDDVRAWAADLSIEALSQFDANYLDLQIDKGDQALHSTRQGLLPVARQVAISNNLLAWESNHNHATTRDKFQQTTLGRIFESMQTFSDPSLATSVELNKKIPNAILVVAPTGSGKTVLEAMTLSQAGIGQPVPGFEDEVQRALLVVPSQQLTRQFLGESGSNTFRRFFGRDVRITSWWQEDKDSSGDIVLTTKQSLPQAVKKGAIRPEDFPVIVIDEAHHLLAPSMQEILGHLAVSRVIGFTATPARDVKRDLRRQLDSIPVGNLREIVEQGILTPVRLYSFKESQERSAESIAVTLAESHIREGKKVVLYCKQGDSSAQATAICDALNTNLTDFSEDQVVAETVGSHVARHVNQSRMQSFGEGKLRALATVRMLREGWDDDVDVVILVGGYCSRVDVEQGCGRGMRPGKDETTLIEVLPKNIESGRPLVSIFEIFDMEVIESGRLITGVSSKQSQKDQSGKPKAKAQNKSAQDAAPIPEDIRGNIVPLQPVRMATVSAADLIRMGEIPEGFRALKELADAHNVPFEILRKQLDQENFFYIPVRATRPGEEFDRWYGPEATEHLNQNPPIHRAEDNEYTIKDMAEMLGISKYIVGRYVNSTKAPSIQRRTGTKNLRSRHYDYPTVLSVIEHFSSIPPAGKGDILVGDLCREISESFVWSHIKSKGIEPTLKRRASELRVRAFAYYVTEAEAAAIGEAYGSFKVATPDHMNYAEIAALAGTDINTIRKALQPEERDKIIQMRIQRKARDGDFLPAEIGLAIAERVRPQKLPLTEVTFSLITSRLVAGKAALNAALSRAGYGEGEVRKLGRRHNAKTYPWAALRDVEKKYAAKPNHPPINFELVCVEPDKLTFRGLAHARHVLEYYLPDSILDTEALDAMVDINTIRGQLLCSNAAFKLLVKMSRTHESDIQHDESGKTIISGQCRERIMQKYDAVGLPKDGWVSYNTIALAIKRECKGKVDVEEVVNSFLADHQPQLGRVSDYSGRIGVDVFFASIHAKYIARQAERLYKRRTSLIRESDI